MKKFIIALIVLGILAFGVSVSSADSTRTINHSFLAVTESVASPNTLSGNRVLPSMTIYRITGVATGSNATYAIYNTATEGAISVASNLAIEGGEATSGDNLPMLYFGTEGLRLQAGTVIRADNCVVVIEYL